MSRVGSCGVRELQTDRIQKFVDYKDRIGEKSIAVAQAAISTFLLCLHIVAGIKNGWESINSSVILCLIIVNVFSLARYLAAFRTSTSPHFFNFLTILDGLTFLLLIMSYSNAYDMPLVSNLKTTSIVFLFVFVGLRTLKSDPLPVVTAGSTIVLGWTGHLILIAYYSPDLQITKSYSEYITTHSLLIGAEVEKIVGVIALTIVTALGVHRSRKVLVKSASVGDLIKERDMIKLLANTDSLTGLSNRDDFRRKLNESLAVVGLSANQPALMLVDLDDFKSINDTMGHPAGDKVLQEISRRLTNLAGKKDVVARLGGDEFAIIVANYKSHEYMQRLAEKVISEVSRVILPRDLNAYVGASIGIAIAPTDWITAEYLMSNTDIALYRSKNRGRGQFTFYKKEFRTQIKENKKVELELKQAIKNNHLKVVYQPKFCLNTSRIYGVEALIRWEHPLQGILSPAQFLPIAEQSSLIVDIGRVVLANVCQLIKRCDEEGFDIGRVAINVAAREFMADNNYFDHLIKTVSEQGIPTERIELEITEQVFLDKRADTTLDTFKNLREKGVFISLDDFGTGYASLMHLSKCPIHAIKLDKSFISGINQNKEDTAIVSSITRMAKEMSLCVTAEGVETLEQFKFVENAGCDFVQGYYIARPLSADDLIDFLEQSNEPILKAVS